MANYPQLDNASGVWNLREVYDAVMGGYWPNANAVSLFCGGQTSATTAVIDKNIFSTSGNSTVFGNLSAATQSLTNSTVSSFTRGLIPGGYISPAYTNKIEYVTFSTEGNAADFGDITVARATGAGFSNSVRGGVGGGDKGGTPDESNVIDYVTIVSTGNATDFGDLTITVARHGGGSNGHGGLS